MPENRSTLTGPPLWLFFSIAALIVLAIVTTVIWVGPLPPRVVLMSTGASGSDYDLLGAQYRDIAKRSGIELRLLPSGGAVENLRRLNDARSGVSVAFAQGGLTNEARSPELKSLGTMFFEPFWLFTRVPAGAHLEGLHGKRVSIGPEGGGTRALGAQLLALNGIDEHIAELLSLSPDAAGKELLSGQIDAAAMVASWDSEVVRQLLASSDVSVVGFPRADAYVALYPYLSKLRLPAGVGNLATNRPPADVDLIAPKASLIVRRDLHPAIQYLLLEAAKEIHSVPNIFQGADEFPAAQRGDLPLSQTATQYYKSGAPFLQRYLPFWLAILASRILLLLIPLLGVAYPVLRLAPSLYAWNVRNRILRLYRELNVIEAELESLAGTKTPDAYVRLRRLEERATRLRLPVSFAPILYALRSHIALIEQRVARGAAQGTSGGPGSVQRPQP